LEQLILGDGGRDGKEGINAREVSKVEIGLD